MGREYASTVVCALNARSARSSEVGDHSCDARGCPLDHRVVNKTCVECGEGLTNLAGDDESGDDTECRGYGSGAGDVYGEWSLFTALAVAFAAAILC